MTEYDSVDELLESYHNNDRPVCVHVRKTAFSDISDAAVARAIADDILDDGYGTVPGNADYPCEGVYVDKSVIPSKRVRAGILQTSPDPRARRDWVVYTHGPDRSQTINSDIVVDITDELTCYAVEATDDPDDPRIVLRKIDYPKGWERP